MKIKIFSPVKLNSILGTRTLLESDFGAQTLVQIVSDLNIVDSILTFKQLEAVEHTHRSRES